MDSINGDEPLLRKPKVSAYYQQNLASKSVAFVPRTIAIIYFLIGITFIILGSISLVENKKAIEYVYTYDGENVESEDCKITVSNSAKVCNFTIEISEDMPSPLMVFYELDNFYSNHRKYVQSFSQSQLTGSELTDLSECIPLEKNETGGTALSPCGLIANTMFNDVISITSGATMDETGIAWKTDFDKFSQPSDFAATECPSGDCVGCLQSAFDPSEAYDLCGTAEDRGGNIFAFWYPNESSTQYLYETFPSIVSPLEGVKNEHFLVWMRVAGLDKFRKPYGRIEQALSAGDTVDFSIVNNFVVESFEGSKSIVLAHMGSLGGSNNYWVVSFFTMGGVVL
mmetsp:Transcript_833/g.1219  ORF Transcript_833/g.1219 Transcript_833/m.1219 type:complete len:341 (-) Transcript_833:54-1076(-)